MIHWIASCLFPAWAGVILVFMVIDYLTGTIPRMGGGDPSNFSTLDTFAGYSPHGRG